MRAALDRKRFAPGRPGRDPSREFAALDVDRPLPRRAYWRDRARGEGARPVFETLDQCSKAQSGRIEHVHEGLLHWYACRHDNSEATI